MDVNLKVAPMLKALLQPRAPTPMQFMRLNREDRVSAVPSSLHCVLIPIDSEVKSAWCVQYVMRLHRNGIPIEVILLNIGEPITQWHAIKLQFWQREVLAPDKRAQAVIDKLLLCFTAKGIACRDRFTPGDVVFSILDAVAEHLCCEVILPVSRKWLFNSFSREVGTAIKLQGYPVDLVLVDHAGIPKGTRI